VVASYKKLGLIEEAFRNLKTVQLEHSKDGPSTTRLMIELKSTCSSARLPITLAPQKAS